jgi:hypothetical protein
MIFTGRIHAFVQNKKNHRYGGIQLQLKADGKSSNATRERKRKKTGGIYRRKTARGWPRSGAASFQDPLRRSIQPGLSG